MSQQPPYKILAIIPARCGSKGIPDKNIKLIANKPLIAHSIEHAVQSKHIDRVIVSTDSELYAQIARDYGAETPFIRPKNISGDFATDLEVFRHALEWLMKNEDYIPDICVHLRPTYPLRHIQDIDAIVSILLENPSIDSVRTIAPAPETPFKMWYRTESGQICPVITTIPEAYNMPRQALPPTYLQNACIDAVRTKVIIGQNSMTGSNIYGYLMEENYDIDNQRQLDSLIEKLEPSNYYLPPSHPGINSKEKFRTYCFDIDGVIATIVAGNQYDLASPREESIAIINDLYNQGHTIILFTARGSATGIDWKEVTERQMTLWGVKYHRLIFGKPAADFYIDDRMYPLEKLGDLLSIKS